VGKFVVKYTPPCRGLPPLQRKAELTELSTIPTPQKINPKVDKPAANPTVAEAQHSQTPPTVKKGINKVADILLTEYLENFWTPESEYANFKKNVQKNPLTPYYIQMNHDDVRRHVTHFPGFEGITVGSLTKATLKKYLIWLAGRRKQYKKKTEPSQSANPYPAIVPTLYYSQSVWLPP